MAARGNKVGAVSTDYRPRWTPRDGRPEGRGLRGPLARGAGCAGGPGRQGARGSALSAARGAGRGPSPLASSLESGTRPAVSSGGRQKPDPAPGGHGGVEPEGLGHWDTPRGTNVDATVLTVALRRPALSVPPGCFLPILFFRGSGLLEGTGIRHQCVSRRADTCTQARGDPELRAGWMA